MVSSQRKGNHIPVPRVLVTMRLRKEVADALSAASCQRRRDQPTGPVYQQEIVEAAVEAWLRKRDLWPKTWPKAAA